MIHLKTDSAKSRRGSQPESESLALPWREWCGALLGGTPGLRGVQLTRLQAHSTQTSGKEVPEGTPKTESEDSQHGGGGVKKGTSPSRSSQGRHLGVGSNSGSGSLRHSRSSTGDSALGSGRERTPGVLDTLGELGRSHSGDGRGTPMWWST